MDSDQPPPDGNTITAFLIVFIVLVALSAFFSATETAFTSVNKARLKLLAEDGNKSAKKALKLTENYDRLLFTILIGNNIVNIVMATISTLMFAILITSESLSATVSTAVSTVVVLIFGEITPKTLAKESPEKVASFLSYPISFFIIILYPLNLVFTGWKVLLSKIFKFKGEDVITEEELLTYVEEASEDGTLDENETELISGAIEFNDVEVGDILVPRVNVVAIEMDTPMDEIKDVFLQNGFSRVPVYKNSIDTIIGMIHEKDFFNAYLKGAKNVKGLITSMAIATEHMKISVLLRTLQKQKVHMATVLDEYGGTLGIVTLEDILEELVGEIWDEHDEVVDYFTKIDDTTYLVDGNAEIYDFCELFNQDEDEESDSNTVSGWVIERMGDIPAIGTTFDYNNLEITVTKRNLRKVLEIKVIVKSEEEMAETEE
ncbi:MAG: HlyC/CorC family transporter [Clostridiales bacterium]|nr:HlyC/CorC family transporter [Clostridiales bacterium]